jgi:phosphate transport system protein
MVLHLHREIEKLKKQIVLLAGVVESRVAEAVRAVGLHDDALAEQIRQSDVDIDQAEVDVEEECLKVLALHQPVAIDLRFIVAVLKINSDLERIGDEAANIAGRALRINAAPLPESRIDLEAISIRVQRMLKKSLDALVNLDVSKAHDVRSSDDEIDDLVHRQFEIVKEDMRAHPGQIDTLVEYMRIFRYLERIADHATNIAEDVVYMIEGEIVRHKDKT